MLASLLALTSAEALPLISGEARDRLTAADLADLRALSPLFLGEPVLIRTLANHPDGNIPTLVGAVVYFAPSERTARCWLGCVMVCYPTTLRPAGTAPDEWRVAGRWMGFDGAPMRGYILVASAGKELPACTPDDFSRSRIASFISTLGSQSLVQIADAARAFHLLRRDGTELAFTDLPICRMTTGTRDDGKPTASVELDPPPGEERIVVHLVQEKQTGWHIVHIERNVWY